MAEEEKQEQAKPEAEQPQQEEKKSECASGKVFLKMALGGGLLVVGCLLVWIWRGQLAVVIKGCLGLFLLLTGAITIAIAKD